MNNSQKKTAPFPKKMTAIWPSILQEDYPRKHKQKPCSQTISRDLARDGDITSDYNKDMNKLSIFGILGLLTVGALLILVLKKPPPIPDNNQNGQTRAVKLYYYNPSKDMDASHNVMCTRTGLVAVERQIPVTQTPIQDTIRLLLRGS